MTTPTPTMTMTTTDTYDELMNGVQKWNIFTQQSPYVDKVRAYAVQSFDDIKQNLSKSLVYNELRPGFLYWTARLLSFLEGIQCIYIFFFKVNFIKS